MGSFNVACSISKISIGPGTPVVYIPLVTPWYRSQAKSSLEIPGPQLIYPNDCFSPMSLPIRGKYNDYGGIEDVVKDDNVKALEAFFGFPAEDLPSHAQRRGLYDYFSATCRRFLPTVKQLEDYNIKFDENFLKAFGFIEVMNEVNGNEVTKTYEYSEAILSVFVTWNSRQLSIVDIDGKVLFTLERTEYLDQLKSTFLHRFSQLAKYYIGAKREHQAILRLLDCMSGMFVLEEVYDTLSKKVYTSDYYGKTYANIFDDHIKALTKLKELENNGGDKEDRLLARLELQASNGYFKEYHRHWAYFEEIYYDFLSDEKLRDEFIAFSIFAINMSAMNNFYFPACNGEQCGNHQASLVLAKKTVEILEAKLKEYEEDDEYDDEPD